MLIVTTPEGAGHASGGRLTRGRPGLVGPYVNGSGIAGFHSLLV